MALFSDGINTPTYKALWAPRANVAAQHSILTAIWNMATTGSLYEDLGGNYYTRLSPQKTKSRAIKQLEAMGYQVTLDNASQKPLTRTPTVR